MGTWEEDGVKGRGDRRAGGEGGNERGSIRDVPLHT